MVSLHLHGQYNWAYVACWTLMTIVGYNTGVMAQRYFSVDNERSARRVALVCFLFFLAGAFIWFIPPMAMRVVHPDLARVLPQFANPHEAAFAAASLTFLPNRLIGIMLAAMFSSAMANLSGQFNMNAAILSEDVYQALLAPQSSELGMLRVGRAMTFAVALSVIFLAVLLACTGKSIFSVLITFNSIIALAYGTPALLGLVIKNTPRWSGMASFGTGLSIGAIGTFLFGWGLVMNVTIVASVAIGVFLASRWFDRPGTPRAERRQKLFLRLETPVDIDRELAGRGDQTARVFRFISRATGAVGLAALLLLFSVQPADRAVVLRYSGITLMVALALSFIRSPRVAD